MSERWKPEKGKMYWMIDFCYTKAVGPMSWAFDWIDTAAYQSGNCFKTEAEAQAAAEKVKDLLLSLHDTTQVNTQDKQLPDWCKVGAWGYDTADACYFEIVGITAFNVDVAYIGKAWRYNIGVNVFNDNYKPARSRPYNAEEMKALVGNTIDYDSHVCLVIGYNGNNNTIFIGNGSELRGSTLMDYYTIDGKPCGVFEHLENGEWVK
jgi:hypothetical protein